jgi:hypothetical protein
LDASAGVFSDPGSGCEQGEQGRRLTRCGGGTWVWAGGRCRFTEASGRCRFTEGRTRGGSLPLATLIGSIDCELLAPVKFID